MYLEQKITPEAPVRADGHGAQRRPGTGRYAGTHRRTLPEDTAWADFLATARVRGESKGSHEVLFHEDDPADHIYEVASGQLMLYRLLVDGRRQVVDIVGPGDLVGLSMTGLYDCTAETLTPVDLRVLERRDVERSRELQTHVNRCLMTRIEALHSHTLLLGRKSAQERVASFLMRFVSKRGVVGCVGPAAGGDETTVVLRMTRQEIADYLGLTIETVSRVLSDMKRRGVIGIEKNDRIRIPNVCRICKLTGIH